MWEKTEKPKTIQVTKALVKEFFEMDPLPHDRPFSERRMQVYEKILAAGEFRPVTWASAYCIETDGTIRVNGKHTSTLLAGLVDSGHDLPEFFVTVERYQCQTLEDVAKLYATFDTSASTRTSNDIIQSFASTVSEFNGLKKKTFALAVAGLSFQKWGTGYHAHPPAERAELLCDNINLVIWLDGVLWPKDTLDQKNASHIWRSPVVGAMVGTFERNQKQSDEFWTLVRDEDHSDRGNPTRVLAKFLSRKVVKTSMTIPIGKEVVPFREMYVRCIHAWNAWHKGRTTDLKYFPKSAIPAIK